MFISDIFLLIIIIVIGLCWGYNSNKIKENYNIQIENLKTDHKTNIAKLNDHIWKLENKHLLDIISLVNNCSLKKAEEIKTIIENSNLKHEFSSVNTLAEKKKIIKQAYKKIDATQSFNIFCRNTLFPIIEKNNYNIKLDTLSWYQDKYLEHTELSDNEKLYILNNYIKNNYLNQNELLLIDLANLSPSSLDNNEKFTQEEILNIMQTFIEYFKIKIDSENLENFYDFFDNDNDKSSRTITLILIRLLYLKDKRTFVDVWDFWEFKEELDNKYFDIFSKELPKKL